MFPPRPAKEWARLRPAIVSYAFASILFSPWTASCSRPDRPRPHEPVGPSAAEEGRPRALPSGGARAIATGGLAGAGEPARERPLTLATWNLAWLAETPGAGPIARSPEAYERLAKYARRLDADVIAVQEVESADALAKVFDASRYAFHTTSDATRQRTGFVLDKRLHVQVFPDYTPLRAGDLRSGADVSITWRDKPLRLLSVHLKSGCFAGALERNDACRKLRTQIPVVEAWMDARGREATAFAVLGDFNRRLFAANDDALWQAWDDGDPPESDLSSPTAGERSRCWSGRHPEFIDHLLLSRSLARDWSPASFLQVTYDADDRPHRSQLSDHCPLRVTLSPDAAWQHSVSSPADPTSGAPATVASPATQALLKGNVSRGGKRYYHSAECPNYAHVKIDEDKGEALFPDEAAAIAAGFERSPDCPRR